MTNEEIISKLRNGEPFDSLGNAIVLTKSDYMNEARADELQEIEKRLQSLIPLPNNEFGQKLGTIMLVIATKLNSLREAI